MPKKLNYWEILVIMKGNYKIQELEEKLEKYRNKKLLDDVDVK